MLQEALLVVSNASSQGRRRIETMGIILFCALMTTVAIQLLVSSSPECNICIDITLIILTTVKGRVGSHTGRRAPGIRRAAHHPAGIRRRRE